ncbi:glutathione synthetase, ATP-grasp domain [Tindallia magadiensis]|uniref:Glutathione synthetase, ATP-grasp domain n=1 Tax=Tindallia magadiensis TaxID=69895 RepID=A0A1I3GQZ0_9FIRM|nr:hypothetical protein [Tindallia magadiensis]SFI25918.1 glutathione synthetase, ATP-grasp domain [Tindallia magadiensis]
MSCHKNVAILVSQKYAAKYHPDDLALKERLETFGCTVSIVPWDDQRILYSKFDTAIVRSCWDYQHRLSEFIQQMKAIEQQCHLVNQSSIIIWNSDKLYLKWLSDNGVPTVPSFFVDYPESLTPSSLNFSAEKLVIKPSIGASGHHTYLVNARDFNSIQYHLNHSLHSKAAVIQPFVQSIQEVGERSAVIIDGEPVFVMKKTPAKDGFLVHEHWGGTYQETLLSQTDHRFLDHLMNVLNPLPLFMRVDFLYDTEGNPMLLELEMIEPNLYLSRNPIGLNKLSHALIR